MIKVERKIAEKMEKMNTEDLRRLIRRGGLEAAKEILSRGEFGIEGEYLREILEIGKISPIRTEEATKIKNETADIIIERFLNERNFRAILREIESQEILEKATRGYRSQAKNIPNFVLMEIIEHVVSERRWAVRVLRDQNPSVDDLLEAIEYAPEEVQKEILQELFGKGLPIEDAVWLIGYHENLADIVWEKLCEGKLIGTLCADSLCEILDYTDSRKVREDSKEMLLNFKDLTVDHLKVIVEALESKSVKRDIKTLKEIVERLESLREAVERRLSEKCEDQWEQRESLVLIGELRERVKEIFKNLKEEIKTAKVTLLVEAGYSSQPFY